MKEKVLADLLKLKKLNILYLLVKGLKKLRLLKNLNLNLYLRLVTMLMMKLQVFYLTILLTLKLLIKLLHLKLLLDKKKLRIY